MAGVITVHLLRHGEVHNPDHVLYGRLPGFRLSELGERQAVAAATWLARRDIAYLVASPLERAQQTAAPLASADRARDRHRRAADRGRQPARGPAGRRRQGAVHRPGELEVLPSTRCARRGASRTSRSPPGCSPRRATPGDRADGREAVCVSHQLPIVSARRSAEGLRLFHDPRKRQCGLASVTSFAFDGDAIVRVDYAEPAADLPAGRGAGA